jgi:hypothetical protein
VDRCGATTSTNQMVAQSLAKLTDNQATMSDSIAACNQQQGMLFGYVQKRDVHFDTFVEESRVCLDETNVRVDDIGVRAEETSVRLAETIGAVADIGVVANKTSVLVDAIHVSNNERDNKIAAMAKAIKTLSARKMPKKKLQSELTCKPKSLFMSTPSSKTKKPSAKSSSRKRKATSLSDSETELPEEDTPCKRVTRSAAKK